jgi:hypothetical protein
MKSMAGGPFKHQKYLKFQEPRPLGDAYLSIAHQMGYRDLKNFSSGSTPLKELT